MIQINYSKYYSSVSEEKHKDIQSADAVCEE